MSVDKRKTFNKYPVRTALTDPVKEMDSDVCQAQMIRCARRVRPVGTNFSPIRKTAVFKHNGLKTHRLKGWPKNQIYNQVGDTRKQQDIAY